MVIVVVPHAGTWIEILILIRIFTNKGTVVPHAGTWIEIIANTHINIVRVSRSPRGNVD